MQTITDEYMRAMLPTARSYTLMILKTTPKRREPGVEKIIWEHGRRNFALRAEGVMPVVCPISDGGDKEEILNPSPWGEGEGRVYSLFDMSCHCEAPRSNLNHFAWPT